MDPIQVSYFVELKFQRLGRMDNLQNIVRKVKFNRMLLLLVKLAYYFTSIQGYS